MNCYEILGVSSNAKLEEITTAFRTLAKKYHPDLSKDNSFKEKFVDIVEAYEILRSVDKRNVYDILINRPKVNENVFYNSYKNDEKHFNEWKDHARKEGEYYAQNKYEIFEAGVLKKIKNIVKKTTDIGIKLGKISLKSIIACSIIFLVIIGITAIIPGIIAIVFTGIMWFIILIGDLIKDIGLV